MLDLKQLRTFLEIAECGSVSKAAERLRIAQPALTRQIHLLESELNTRLLDRHSRGVDLTDDGKAFLLRARSLIREAERTREEFRARSGQVSGPVALAIAPALVDYLLGAVIERYTNDYPDVTIEIVEGFTGYIEEWLIDGRVDLAVLYDPKPDKRVRRHTLIQEKLYVVGQSSMNLRCDEAVPLKDIAAHDLITASRDQRLREVVEDAMERSGAAFSVRYEANSLNVHKALVRSGLGVSILPLGAVQRDVDAGSLSAAPIKQPDIVWDVTLATPALSRPTIAARTLTAAIQDMAAALIKKGAWPGQA